MISLVRWIGPPLLMGLCWVAMSPMRTAIYVLGAVYFVVLLVSIIPGLVREGQIEKRRAAHREVEIDGRCHRRRLAVLRIRAGRPRPGDEELANDHATWLAEAVTR